MDTEKNIKSNQENIRDSQDTLIHNHEQKSKTCNYAIYALALGISCIVLTGLSITFNSCYLLLLIPLTASSAIILGLMALLDTKLSKGNIKSASIALAGFAIPTIWIATFTYFFMLPLVREVKQQAHFFSIDTSIEIFNSESDGYPPSEALDPVGKPYCGALKLCEALVGQDLRGFHKESVFRSDGMNAEGSINLYSEELFVNDPNSRIRLSLRPNHVDVYCLKEIFTDVNPFDGNNFVLCDKYTKKRHSGKKIGMPVLYYKADTLKTAHDINDPDNPDNIYNYKDNHDLLALGVPGKPNLKHPMFEDPKIFYELTRNDNVTTSSRPFRSDTIILLSAGYDGLYGTKDDIANFDMKWKSKKE